MADPRALRISAALTTVVLALSLVAGPVAGLPLMAVQTFVFAFGAVLGLQAQPYVLLARRIGARREAKAAARAAAAAAGAEDLDTEAHGEDVEPTTPRGTVAEVPFQVDQGVGMLLTASALLWGTLGAAVPFYVLGGIAAALALVNVITGSSVGGVFIQLGERASDKASTHVGRLADAIDARAAARQAAAPAAASAPADSADASASEAPHYSSPQYAPAQTPAPEYVTATAAPATSGPTDFYDFEADEAHRPVVSSSRRADARVG